MSDGKVVAMRGFIDGPFIQLELKSDEITLLQLRVEGEM